MAGLIGGTLATHRRSLPRSAACALHVALHGFRPAAIGASQSQGFTIHLGMCHQAFMIATRAKVE
ncbi:MAG: hypothetical protein ACKPEY_18065 [Planctomycetota bacterium]